uniref:Integrase zinc-binding domain-containing protein n=1 Tax=Trichuris muris TaxID=70415 RepID=A0A5S6QKS5_TRIMR
MRRDVTRFYNECQTCQKCKLPRPTKAPLQNMPIGRPWERLGMDILELPQSSAGNHYALVIQDYFTKWEELLELQANEELKSKFKLGYRTFWLQRDISRFYPRLCVVADLLTKKRNKLQIVNRGDLRLRQTSIEPNIEKLLSLSGFQV